MKLPERHGVRSGAMALLLLAQWLLASQAWAHESRPAYLEIKEAAANQFSVLWRTPVLAGNQLLVKLKLPDGVTDLQPEVIQQLADSRVERRWIDAGPDGLAGKRIEFVGLQFTITDVLARIEFLDGRELTMMARPSQPWVRFSGSQTSFEVAATYIKEGIRHIGLGFDHLLFVFALLLIVKGGWMLVKTITAFTVAHSITLALATLGVLQPPPRPPIEAAIALSILFLAVEVLRDQRGETSFTIRNPWIVAFIFGLLHGFGFSSVMIDAGLPRSELPLALFSFNVGVEIGQLIFVAVVVAVVALCRRLRVEWPHWSLQVPVYVVGTLGAFWSVRGVVQMFGMVS